MAKKPTPGMLGKGMAAKAGKALKGRKSKMEEEIEKATGGSRSKKRY